MSNRRVKSLAVEDDDGAFDEGYSEDEYDEPADEELTEEDKEQLRSGTIKVRQSLGPGYSISEKEIHDTLWHYFYDVGKSVTYLKSWY